jgi:hypothetical protein
VWQFVNGANLALCLVIAVGWWRSWQRTDDAVFRLFAGAFVVLALNYVVVTAFTNGVDSRPGAYLVRLLAYVLIIAAIVSANRPARAPEVEDVEDFEAPV